MFPRSQRGEWGEVLKFHLEANAGGINNKRIK